MQELTTYKRVNLILLGIYILVIVYSAVFSYKNSNYPIPSFHDSISSEPNLSSGLSRSFSAIVRLQFDIAHQFNRYGLLVFLFFIEQISLRILLSLLLIRKPKYIKTYLIADGVTLLLGLFIHFKPFYLETVYR